MLARLLAALLSVESVYPRRLNFGFRRLRVPVSVPPWI
jgi:hypothetical protein